MTQARVMVISLKALADILSARSRVLNLPADARIVAAVPARDGIGIRVHSLSYEPVPQGEMLPLVPAVTTSRGKP